MTKETSGMITRKRRNSAGLGQVEYLPSFNILSGSLEPLTEFRLENHES